MGISRVFQTPEIFGDLTVMENMLIPMLCQARRVIPDACHGKHREREVDHRESRSHAGRSQHGDKRDMHCRLAVARRQAAPGDGHVPRAGTEAAAARRTDRRHGARRHQQHHRSAQADPCEARHHHGDHRTRHARGVLPRPADHRSRARHAAGRRHTRKHQGPSEGARKPIWERAHDDAGKRHGRGQAAPRFFQERQPCRHRAGLPLGLRPACLLR
jgi:hypothetical protein